MRIVDRLSRAAARWRAIGFLLHPDVEVALGGRRRDASTRGATRARLSAPAVDFACEDAVWWPDMGDERRDEAAAADRGAGGRTSEVTSEFIWSAAERGASVKQVQQNYRSGELKVAEVPAPALGAGELLVATRVSLISSGTERQLMQLAKSSLVGKAAARPDLVRRVLVNVKKEGLRPTFDKVFAKLDTPIPLGYSLVGEVDRGRRATSPGFALGDRVACAGAGLANHAEINAVPKNLCVRVPAGVDDEDASFVTLGAIALQGVRQAAPTLGEIVVVMGLGLIGLLTVQILKANGCRVIGFDPNPARAALAKQLGADIAVSEALAEVALAPHRRRRRRRGDRHRLVEIERADQPGRRDQPRQGPHRRGRAGRHDHRPRAVLQARARTEAVDVLRARPRRSRL